VQEGRQKPLPNWRGIADCAQYAPGASGGHTYVSKSVRSNVLVCHIATRSGGRFQTGT